MKQRDNCDHFQKTNLEFVYYFNELNLALLKCNDCGDTLMVKATEYGATSEF